MHHVRQGNRAAVAARKKRQPLPRPARRPGAAGRYVCAVFVCADADVNVAEALGLRRRDVLVLSNPGPFVQPEAVALIEQQVQRERLALVLVLTHEQCETLAMKSGDTSRTKALAGRVAPIGRRARRHKVSMAKAMARHQREVLLASSPRLQKRVAKDQLRILPASIDPRTLTLTWHTTRADEMPMAPVK
ncbi:MAG: hypothetical protein NXI31_19475 [bacterium]|nr:hypothetical protein [bacterium]